MNNIETLRHRIRVHIANREHYSKVEFLDKLHEILHESEQPGAQPAPVQEPDARIAELEETVRQLNHALREATESPTFMGEPVVAAPAARIKGFDEYGPLLEWNKHWVNFPVGTRLYITPPAAQPAPVQETVAWVLLREDEDGFEPIQFYGGKQKPEVAGELKARFTLRPVCFADTTPRAAQPAHVPLTDEQIDEIVNRLDPLFLDVPQGFTTDFARAIEAKLKEQNT